MMYREKPHFVIKKRLQKSLTTGVYFCDIINDVILEEISLKITSRADFECEFVDNDYCDDFLEPTYNKGRLAILQYHDEVSYISFSEKIVNGRNSSVQSVPTAFNLFYSNSYCKKTLYYYFLDDIEGNTETDYQIFIYRLMSTIGFKFLNPSASLASSISAFSSVDDVIHNREHTSTRNRSNNSTYITRDDDIDNICVYAKTYGANKYESSLICYALAQLCRQGQTVTLYEVQEHELTKLPKSSQNVLSKMGNITVTSANITLEKKFFDENNSFRSPQYTYNLFRKFGDKKCILCNCQLPHLIQGAHVLPVADIKKFSALSYDQKFQCAIDGENGLWLCANHHKLFDSHNIFINDKNGQINYEKALVPDDIAYIKGITLTQTLPDGVMTDKFSKYLWERNKLYPASF